MIATIAFGIEINSFKDPKNEVFKIAETLTNFASFKTMIKFLGYVTVPFVMRALKLTLFGDEVEKFFRESVIDIMETREEKEIVRHDLINLFMQLKNGILLAPEESDIGVTGTKGKLDDGDMASQ